MARLTISTNLESCQKSYVFCVYVSGHGTPLSFLFLQYRGAPLFFLNGPNCLGWGHATRANQIITDILNLPAKHKVYVVSNASDFIFRDVIKLGAIYRQADIDAGVVQPLAYTVDRLKTIANLKLFLERRPETLQTETEWLKQVGADCVVCDAPFLPW